MATIEITPDSPPEPTPEELEKIKKEFARLVEEAEQWAHEYVKEFPPPKIVYCMNFYEERMPQVKRCIEQVRPYVDRCILVYDDSVTEESKKWLQQWDCELYYRKWDNHFSKQRNAYLEHVNEGEWVLVSDPDELFSTELLIDLRKICSEAEKRGINILGINAHDITTELDGTVTETVSDWFKQLLFKYEEGVRYVGCVHETLLPGIHGWRPANLDKRYYYKHIKSMVEIKERGARNVFCGGGGCLTPDSFIITANGFKRAGHVKVGDLVLNANGAWTKVKEIETHDYCGEVFIVTPFHGFAIACSETQKVLAMARMPEGTLHMAWCKASNLNKHLLYMPKNSPPSYTMESIIHFKKLSSGGKLNLRLLPFRIPLSDPDFWYFIGFWLADGSVSSNKIIEICVSSDVHCQKLKSVIEKVVPSRTVFFHKDKRSSNYVGLRFSHAALARWLLTTFGKGAKNKHLPIELLGLERNCLEGLINGIFDGDGTCGVTNSNSNVRVLNMANAQITMFAYLALLKLGYFPSISCPGKTKGRYGVSENYRLYVNKRKPEEMKNHVGHQIETGVAMPIREQTIVNYEGKLVDIKVEDGDSFICPYLTIHNNNVKDRNPMYVELHMWADKHGIKEWPALREYIRKGNIDAELLEIIIKHRNDSGWDWENESRDFFLWLKAIHPELVKNYESNPQSPSKGSPPEVMAYVEEQYLKILGRHADDMGKQAYTKQILEGRIKREDLPKILMGSQEYRTKHGL